MSVVEAMLHTAPVYPNDEPQQHGHSDTPDAALVQLCQAMQDGPAAIHRYTAIEPQSWEGFSRSAAAQREAIRQIANTPACSRAGLRAKARALYALLDEGEGGLYEDASMPDQLAWSLVLDILAE